VSRHGPATAVDGDDRGLSTVVGKLLEIGIVVLYIGLLTTTLYGGVVPTYEAAAGREMGERTLALAAQRIEGAVPANATAVTARVSVDLPRAIAGEGYTIRTDGRALVLDHPDRGVDARTRLALPTSVVNVSGRWQSTDDVAVAVTHRSDGLALTLVSGGER